MVPFLPTMLFLESGEGNCNFKNVTMVFTPFALVCLETNRLRFIEKSNLDSLTAAQTFNSFSRNLQTVSTQFFPHVCRFLRLNT